MNCSSRAVLTLGLLAVPAMAKATEPQSPLTAEVRIYLQPFCNVFRVKGPTSDHTDSTRPEERPVSPPPELLAVKELRVIALPDEVVPFHGRLDGFRVWIVNGTAHEELFSIAGSQLSMLREILDPDDRWRPIEALPGRLCGDGHRSVRLPAGQAWSLAIPRTAGPLSTSMRFRLEMPDGPIYSNPFSASIDPRLLDVERGP